MEPKKKGGSPKGSVKKRSPEAEEAAARSAKSLAYVMTPELEAAIENKMAEVSPPIKIEGYHYPSNWDTMGKIDRLKFLTANRKK